MDQSSKHKLLQSTKCPSWNITNDLKVILMYSKSLQQKDMYHNLKGDVFRIILKGLLISKNYKLSIV